MEKDDIAVLARRLHRREQNTIRCRLKMACKIVGDHLGDQISVVS